MPYISLEELRTIDNYLTKQCELNIPTVRAMPDADFEKEIEEYHQIVDIFFKLYDKQKKHNEISKEGMRKHREKNPEKAREYARNYYRKRKEAK